MKRIYCDRCKKEIWTTWEVKVTGRKGELPTITSHYDLCDECVEKIFAELRGAVK